MTAPLASPTSFSAYDGLFHEIKPGLFIRNCIGMEALSCYASERGCSHITTSSCIKLKTSIDADRFKRAIQTALIRLRFRAPAIAIKSSPPSNNWRLEYNVPKSLEDAWLWTEQIVIMHDCGSSLQANHDRVYRERWWKTSEERYTWELHILPNQNPSNINDTDSWTLTLSSHHSNSDARSGFIVFDLLFEFLHDELQSSTLALDSLEWGQEVSRLPIASQMVWSVHETGNPEPLPTLESTAPPPTKDKSQVIWTYNTNARAEDAGFDYSTAVKLSRDETTKLHAACKTHGRTITQVILSLACLATLEAVLRQAIVIDGSNRFKELISLFDSATDFPIGSSSVDMRARMPREYQEFGFDIGMPMMSMDILAFSFPFGPFRDLLSLDGDSSSVTRKIDNGTFWDKLVPTVTESLQAQDISVEAYRKRSTTFTAVANDINFDSEVLTSDALCLTSVGDLTRLGYLESFRASSEEAGSKLFVVEDIDHAARSGAPAGLFVCWQFNGCMTIKTFTGSKFVTQEEVDTRAEILREWIIAFI